MAMMTMSVCYVDVVHEQLLVESATEQPLYADWVGRGEDAVDQGAVAAIVHQALVALQVVLLQDAVRCAHE